MLEPTAPGRQLEMFRSVDKVVARTVGEGLDDVAEVTAHHNQASVNGINTILWLKIRALEKSLAQDSVSPHTK